MPFIPGTTDNDDGGSGSSTSGRGIVGNSTDQAGVVGSSTNFVGVWGESKSPANAGQPGVFGKSEHWQGVHGESTDQAGVVGVSTNFVGVWGESKSPANAGQPGVFGKSEHWQGVHGESTDQAGVVGVSTNFVGVWGESKSPANAGQPGVFGKSEHWQGVHGESTDQAGVVGVSTNFVGVWGESQSPAQPGVFGKGPDLAGRFDGNVEVTGDVRLTNADCAEDFDLALNGEHEDVPAAAWPDDAKVTPGTVMVLDSEGALRSSDRPYDKRVAGVVSGGGNYRPGLILDRKHSTRARVPVALLGKVYCQVDADESPIEVGDLLTTAPRRGHAMKASDSARAFGAVLGKALRPLASGQAQIPVLVALQ